MNPQQHAESMSQTGSDERSALLTAAIGMTIEAANQLQRVDEQRLSQILGGLVRNKLLSADDSYKLRDRLQDLPAFEQALEDRVVASLQKRGLLTPRGVSQLKSRLQELESKQNA